MTTPLFVRKLTDSEQAILHEWLNCEDLERSRRAKVILQSASGRTALDIGQEMGFHPDNLKKWIRKFNQQGIEGIEVLKRGPRNRFSDQQIAAILELYRKSPLVLGLPFISWTPQKLAIAAVKEGIVSQISHVTVRQLINERFAAMTEEDDLADQDDLEEDTAIENPSPIANFVLPTPAPASTLASVPMPVRPVLPPVSNY